MKCLPGLVSHAQDVGRHGLFAGKPSSMALRCRPQAALRRINFGVLSGASPVQESRIDV
jgi:hypothetical protein